jgi:hypothetical protein
VKERNASHVATVARRDRHSREHDLAQLQYELTLLEVRR